MKADVWMPLYIGDYLADTGRLNTEGHGAYLLMLMDYWRTRQGLPDDDEQLGAITKLGAARFRRLRPMLMQFFTIQGGRWVQKRLEQELRRAASITEARTQAGKNRWSKARAQQNPSKDTANSEQCYEQNGSKTNAIAPVLLTKIPANEEQSSSPSPSQSQSQLQSPSHPPTPGECREGTEPAAQADLLPPPASPAAAEGGDKAKPSSLEQVIEFCKKLDLPQSDAEYFWHSRQANDWKNGSHRIKDWKATIRAWKAGGYLPSQRNPTGAPARTAAPDTAREYTKHEKGFFDNVFNPANADPSTQKQ